MKATAILLVGLVSTPGSLAPDLRIVPQERWSSFFGGSRVTLNFAVETDDAPVEGLASWSLALGRAALERGEMKISARPGRPVHLCAASVASRAVPWTG